MAWGRRINFDEHEINIQERLRQQAIKDAEKERAQFYAKQKEGQKDVRAKYREKVKTTFEMLHILYHN